MANILIAFKNLECVSSESRWTTVLRWISQGVFYSEFRPGIHSHYGYILVVRNIGSWHDATRDTLLHTGLLLLVLGHACDYQR